MSWNTSPALLCGNRALIAIQTQTAGAVEMGVRQVDGERRVSGDEQRVYQFGVGAGRVQRRLDVDQRVRRRIGGNS